MVACFSQPNGSGEEEFRFLAATLFITGLCSEDAFGRLMLKGIHPRGGEEGKVLLLLNEN